MNPLLLIGIGLFITLLGFVVGLRILAGAMVSAISGWRLPAPPTEPEQDNVVPIRKPEEPLQASQKETEQ